MFTLGMLEIFFRCQCLCRPAPVAAHGLIAAAMFLISYPSTRSVFGSGISDSKSILKDFDIQVSVPAITLIKRI